MKIILYQPEIPQNTGNIVRTCRVVGAALILIRPLGFATCSRMLKRAGLDYWDGVDVQERDDLENYLSTCPNNCYFFSSKAKKYYTDVAYDLHSELIFGSETKGLPPIFFNKWPDRFVTIPMQNDTRCLNLSNAVAIALYEAKRQHNFQF